MNWNKYDEISNKRETARKTADFLGNLYYSDLECDREMLLYAWKKAETEMNRLNDEANALLREED